MDVGLYFLDGPANINIGLPAVAWMNTPLQADLHRTTLPGVVGTGLDFGQWQIVCGFPQLLWSAPFGKSTELTLEAADIRIVDVSRDDIGDIVAIHRGTKIISSSAQNFLVRAACVEQRDDVSLVQSLSAGGAHCGAINLAIAAMPAVLGFNIKLRRFQRGAG